MRTLGVPPGHKGLPGWILSSTLLPYSPSAGSPPPPLPSWAASCKVILTCNWFLAGPELCSSSFISRRRMHVSSLSALAYNPGVASTALGTKPRSYFGLQSPG